jgi:hypothetical protein
VGWVGGGAVVGLFVLLLFALLLLLLLLLFYVLCLHWPCSDTHRSVARPPPSTTTPPTIYSDGEVHKWALDSNGRRTARAEAAPPRGDDSPWVLNIDLEDIGALREALKRHDGCAVEGWLALKRVAGSVHFGVRAEAQLAAAGAGDVLAALAARHVSLFGGGSAEATLLNASHVIRTFRFGAAYPGQAQPLEGTRRVDRKARAGRGWGRVIGWIVRSLIAAPRLLSRPTAVQPNHHSPCLKSQNHSPTHPPTRSTGRGRRQVLCQGGPDGALLRVGAPHAHAPVLGHRVLSHPPAGRARGPGHLGHLRHLPAGGAPPRGAPRRAPPRGAAVRGRRRLLGARARARRRGARGAARGAARSAARRRRVSVGGRAVRAPGSRVRSGRARGGLL